MDQHLSDLILNHLLDGVLIVDKEGVILYANKAAGNLFCQPVTKLTGQNFGFPVFPDEVQEIELVRNGELLIVQMLASKINWNGHEACLLSIRDITELIKLSKDLENQKLQLENSNNELEQYASLASHDLKEPIRKILLYSERLLHKPVVASDSDINKQITKIFGAASRMKMLMNGIADFAKTTREDSFVTEVDLNMVVKDVLADLELMIAEKQATFSIDKLPSVKAVAIQIHQLFLNLISNAIKYSREEVPPHITIQKMKTYPVVEISIADNGIGFDSALAKKIFEPFQRLKSSNQEGSGIGLAICKKIIEAHGGKINVKSKPGLGTEFIFSIAAEQTE